MGSCAHRKGQRQCSIECLWKGTALVVWYVQLRLGSAQGKDLGGDHTRTCSSVPYHTLQCCAYHTVLALSHSTLWSLSHNTAVYLSTVQRCTCQQHSTVPVNSTALSLSHSAYLRYLLPRMYSTHPSHIPDVQHPSPWLPAAGGRLPLPRQLLATRGEPPLSPGRSTLALAAGCAPGEPTALCEGVGVAVCSHSAHGAPQCPAHRRCHGCAPLPLENPSCPDLS